MKWDWLTRHHNHTANEIDPEVDEQIKRYVEAAEARQPRVDHVANETHRMSKANHFGPKVASALGVRPK